MRASPPTAARRSCRPRSPLPAVEVGAADAVVGDAHDHGVAVAAHARHARLRRLRVARDVGQRLGHDEVGGRLDRRGEPLVDRARRRGRAPARARPATSIAGARPRSVRIAGWMPRASSRSSAERGGQPLGEPVDQRRRPRDRDRERRSAQLERERDELLLGAVVEVALDPPARGVGRLDDAQARDAQLLHAARAGRPSGARCRWPATTPPRPRAPARGWCPARRRGRSPRRAARRARPPSTRGPSRAAGSSTGWPGSSTKASRSGSQ